MRETTYHILSRRKKRLASKDFVRGFLNRHKPQGFALNRVFGLNKLAVNNYFTNLKTMLDKHKLEPHQIYNCDKTGLTCVNKPSKVIVPKGKHFVSSVTCAELGVTTTILCAVNATGHFVPPMMIFRRKKVTLTDHPPAGTLQGCSENGWIYFGLFLLC